MIVSTSWLVMLVMRCLGFLEQSDEIQVAIPQGVLQGVAKVSSDGQPFYAFLGIPYAKPSIGDLRFEPPEPAESWDGVRDATKPGSKCLQYEGLIFRKVGGSEDCLFLNVFTVILLIIVFIHGGGFTTGSGFPDHIYGPEFIMNRDVVFVTINYRLNVLGFLSLSNPLISGNMGLKDQALALKWVKENIESFGGDSNKIIIYGQSAGGASVHYQMLTPLTKGLFNGVVAMSGTAIGGYTLMDEELSKKRAKIILDYVNCPNNFSEETVKCLKQVEGKKLVEGVSQLKEYGLQPAVPFSPTVEPEGSKNIFINETPEEIIKKGNINDVPLLMGYTSNEALPFVLVQFMNPRGMSLLQNDYKTWLSVISELKDRVNNHSNIMEKAKERYLGDKEVNYKSIKEVTELLSDAVFVYSIYKAGLLHMSNPANKSPVHVFKLSVYPMNRKTMVGLAALGRNITGLGVGHGEDISFIFNTKIVKAKLTEYDKVVSNNLIDILDNFATTGSPASHYISSVWKPLTPDFRYTEIKYELKETDDFPIANMEFWDKLYTDDNKL